MAKDYLAQVKPMSKKYNSARDNVDQVISELEFGPPPSDPTAFLERGVATFDRWLTEMNAAYGSLGRKTFPPRFQSHHRSTLLAWHFGI